MRKQIYLDLFGKGKEEYELVERKIICVDIRVVGAHRHRSNILMTYEVRKNNKTYKFNQERIFNGSFASVKRLVKFLEKRWRELNEREIN